MQEFWEYYLLGLTLKMEGGVGSGSGSGSQGPSGQAGSSGTSSLDPSGSRVLPKNTEGDFSFESLDNLLDQIRQQIKQGTGPSIQEVAKQLEKDLKKLHDWEAFVAKDLPKKLAALTPYHGDFTHEEYLAFVALSVNMAETGTDVFHGGRIVKTEEYANAHKNLSNKQRDNYGKWFSMYKPVMSRLEIEDPERANHLSVLVTKLRKDVEYKQNAKIELTTKLKESSIKYDKLKKD